MSTYLKFWIDLIDVELDLNICDYSEARDLQTNKDKLPALIKER